MAKEMVRFGPAGRPIGCAGTTAECVEYTANEGLNAYEIEWVRNVPTHLEEARMISPIAKSNDVKVSVHGPYWINCCALTKAKTAVAMRGLLQGLKAGEAAGAYAFVFHPGYYLKQSSSEAYAKVKNLLKEVLQKTRSEGIKNIQLAPETTGKQKAFGTLEENVRLAQELGCILTVDFAHLFCRNFCKAPITKEDYKKIFDYVEKNLGARVAKNLHVHFTEVVCNKEGNERHHLPIGAQNTPPFKPLAEVIVENGYAPTIISESPKLDLDALKMKKIVEGLR